MITDTEKLVVGIAGQSNASGRGGMPSAVNNPTDSLMWILGDDYRWYNPGNEPSDKRGTFQVTPINYDSNAEYSAGYSISQRLHLYYPDIPVVISNCAKGSTSISEWQPSRDDNTLFGAAIKKLYAAQSQGKLSFLFFFQGEKDSYTLEDALAWSERFDNVVTGFREHFGDDLPVIYAQIADIPLDTYPYRDVVQFVQSTYSRERVAMITTKDLELRPDLVHLKTPSQIEVGIRVVDAYWNIMQGL